MAGAWATHCTHSREAEMKVRLILPSPLNPAQGPSPCNGTARIEGESSHLSFSFLKNTPTAPRKDLFLIDPRTRQDDDQD